MKKNYVLIIVVSIILGVSIGSVIRDYNMKKYDYISKDEVVKKEIKLTNKSIKKLRKEKEDLDIEIADLKERYNDIEKINQVHQLKEKLSYTDVKGKGIIIEIDAVNEEAGNISNLIDYNKIIINLINDLKANKSELISVNEERINQYSEVILAGSHININSIPIAQPYEIKCIGNVEKLSEYVNGGSSYLKNLQKNYPIKIDLKIDDNIVMNKMTVPNKLKYMEDDKNSIRRE